MGFWLLDNPNPNGDHFYTTRRKQIKAAVIHITAGLEDLDLLGIDHSAEKTAEYAATTTRSVSWHMGADSDSKIDLLPWSYTAFQCVNYNSSTVGLEISKRFTDWRNAAPEWRRRTFANSVDLLKSGMEYYKIPLRHATKAELDYAILTDGPPVGFVGHFQLDPTRRDDPGRLTGTDIDTFPWDEFINAFNTQPTPIDNRLDPQDMVLIQTQKGIVLVAGDQRYGLNISQVNALKAQGVKLVYFNQDPLIELGARVLGGTPTS